MKFIINKTIRYHEDSSRIDTQDGSAEPIILTATLNRLLLLFVKNNHQILSREYLLEKVWGEHGQVASDNNLNNSMSVLRKILASFGEDDIFITLPKQGFSLNAKEINTIDDQAVINGQSLISTPPVSPSRSVHGPLKAVLALLVLALSGWLVLLLLSYRGSVAFLPDDSYALGDIGKCQVFIMSSHHRLSHSQLELEKVKAKAEQFDLGCQTPAKLFYYDVGLLSRGNNNKAQTSFIAYCPLTPDSTKIYRCENYYENEKL